MASSFSLSFLKKLQRTNDVVSFFFEKPEGFDFIPGQYLYITIPHQDADDRGTTRYFTISASPTHENLMITTKILNRPSTFKRHLNQLQAGDTVTTFGPMGTFVLDETANRHHVLLAGGIGMTPYYSMISYIADKKLSIPVTLLVSFSSEKEKVFYEELTALAKNNPQLSISYRSKKLSKELITKHIPGDARYFLVGPSAMVEATKQLLTQLEIPTDQIVIEDFHGY